LNEAVADRRVVEFYSAGTYERERLRAGRGQLELRRVQQLLRRALPAPPARVLDIGGGPGTHAAWLAADGYDVQLIDLVPELVAQARRLAGDPPAFKARRGDARELGEPDESADAALLLGPLYHLPERADRQRALEHAWRALRPGGLLAAAGVSRFAGLLDALRTRRLDDDQAARLAAGPLRDGRLLQSTVFTTAYLHAPGELAAELVDAGLCDVEELAVEGPGWLLFDAPLPEGSPGTPNDPELVAQAARAAELVERDRSLLGASAHLLALGRKPGFHARTAPCRDG
jgi:SAM-dependent methyltransferase